MCIFIPYLITQAISNTFQVSCETNKTPAFFDASLNFQLAKEGEKKRMHLFHLNGRSSAIEEFYISDAPFCNFCLVYVLCCPRFILC